MSDRKKDDQERRPLLDPESDSGDARDMSSRAASAAQNPLPAPTSSDDLSQRLAALKAPAATGEDDGAADLQGRLDRLKQVPSTSSPAALPSAPMDDPEDVALQRRLEALKRTAAEEEERRRRQTTPLLATSSLFAQPPVSSPYTLPIADPVPSVSDPNAPIAPPKVQLQLTKASIQAEAMKQIFNLFSGELGDKLVRMIPNERELLTQHYVFPNVKGTLSIDGSKGLISISDDNDELIARMLAAAKIAADLAINPVFEINGDEKTKAKVAKLFQAHGLRIGAPPAKEAKPASPSPNA